jgi:hypothetical protein
MAIVSLGLCSRLTTWGRKHLPQHPVSTLSNSDARCFTSPSLSYPSSSHSTTNSHKETVDLTGTWRLSRTLTAVANTCKDELLVRDSPC